MLESIIYSTTMQYSLLKQQCLRLQAKILSLNAVGHLLCLLITSQTWGVSSFNVAVNSNTRDMFNFAGSGLHVTKHRRELPCPVQAVGTQGRQRAGKNILCFCGCWQCVQQWKQCLRRWDCFPMSPEFKPCRGEQAGCFWERVSSAIPGQQGFWSTEMLQDRAVPPPGWLDVPGGITQRLGQHIPGGGRFITSSRGIAGCCWRRNTNTFIP